MAIDQSRCIPRVKDVQVCPCPGRTGERLYVRARLAYRDDEMANFDCEVTDPSGTRSLAKASLNVYQPHDVTKLISSPANS